MKALNISPSHASLQSTIFIESLLSPHAPVKIARTKQIERNAMGQAAILISQPYSWNIGKTDAAAKRKMTTSGMLASNLVCPGQVIGRNSVKNGRDILSAPLSKSNYLYV
jgi:hypothetical protein